MWPKDPRILENILPTVCEKHVFRFFRSSANKKQTVLMQIQCNGNRQLKIRMKTLYLPSLRCNQRLLCRQEMEGPRLQTPAQYKYNVSFPQINPKSMTALLRERWLSTRRLKTSLSMLETAESDCSKFSRPCKMGNGHTTK